MSHEITSERVRIEVADGTAMEAYVARPAGAGPWPGVLVLQEIFGVNVHIRSVADRIAREGYVALAPDLFHRTDPGFDGSYDRIQECIDVAMKYTGEQSEADLRASGEHLGRMAGVQGDRLAAIGFCMGGRLAFSANAFAPLRAAVSYYGGGIHPDKIHLAAQLSGPTLFFWAGKDQYIPSEQHRAVVDELRKLGKPFVSVEFSDVNHGFFCDARADYDENAAAQAWALTREFLRRHLAGG
jgi:carboxymethylenebutenolidase